ncbi:MAG: hypothetical protein J2P43_01165 [Candidatus Dormibacteraeota bacterium]|nr:hypothetical protein [Candidatus Dormibacteraeota bacterium]
MSDVHWPLWYSPDGDPITVEEWERFLHGEVWEREHLLTQVSPDVRVSTVWLGLNHDWDPDRPALIFETMIFGGVYDQEQWRYSTREQAHAGHEEAVRQARAGLIADPTPEHRP